MREADLRSLIPALRDAIHAKGATRRFGFTRRELELIAREGLIDVVDGPVTGLLGKGPYYGNDSIIGLIDDLYSAAGMVRSDLERQQFVSALRTGSSARRTIATLRVLLNGGLPEMAPCPSATSPLTLLRVRVAKISANLIETLTPPIDSHDSSLIDSAEVAEILKTRVTVVGRLEKRGLITPVFTRPKQFSAAAIQEFSSEYMLGAELMRSLGLVHAKQVKALLAKHGIKSVDHARRRLDLVYDRWAIAAIYDTLREQLSDDETTKSQKRAA